MAAPEILIVARQEGRAAAKEITPLEDTASWSTVAVGGFADATFQLPGPPQQWRRALPYLSVVQIMYGTELVWEGQVEDLVLSVSGGQSTTTVQCFGRQRLLTETTVRRIWSKRDLNWAETAGGLGASLTSGVTKADLRIDIGQYDQTDLTKNGVQVSGNGVTVAPAGGQCADLRLPIAVSRFMCDYIVSGANFTGGSFAASVFGSADGSTFSSGVAATTASGAMNAALPAGTVVIRIFVFNNIGGSITPTATDQAQFNNFRILGSTLTEDAPGGFYGGSILNDLVALIPGLTPGIIESGSDYTIQAIERSVRDTALSVVQEVASYYSREWAVWENGRLDWRSLAPDPEWIIALADCDSANLDGSLDGIARTTYVLYTDAASGLDAEASAASTEQTNPYYKQGRTKDVIVEPGVPMTANTSAQLAAIVNSESSKYVPVTGTLTLDAKRLVTAAKGGIEPAYTIRAGQDVLIPDLPRDDLFLPQGRDMQTLFHIASVEVSLPDQKVTLTLQGQTKRADVLIARLAAATRTLTG